MFLTLITPAALSVIRAPGFAWDIVPAKQKGAPHRRPFDSTIYRRSWRQDSRLGVDQAGALIIIGQAQAFGR